MLTYIINFRRTNPNHNYKILSKHLLCAKLKHIPRKVKKIIKRRHLKEKWMTKELLQEVVTKNKLYVEWKTTPVTHLNNYSHFTNLISFSNVIFECIIKSITIIKLFLKKQYLLLKFFLLVI